MEAVPPADEIDISNKQSLQIVLNFLEKHFPESLVLWQLLKYIQLNLITKDYTWPHQLFVNDQDQIQCVLFIYSPIGLKSNYQLLTEEEKSTKICVTFFCANNHDHLLIPLLRQYVPWSKIKQIRFCTIQHQFALVTESFVNDNNLGKCHRATYHQMELDKTTFANKIRTFSYSCPSDIDIRPLSVSDAAIINDLWTYKSTISLYQITYEIQHLPAFGTYRDGKLISWCLTKFDGSIGTVFTKPEARGLGLATILIIHLLSKLFELQERAFCYIVHDNIASLRMFEKLGYHRTCDMDWLVVTSE